MKLRLLFLELSVSLVDASLQSNLQGPFPGIPSFIKFGDALTKTMAGFNLLRHFSALLSISPSTLPSSFVSSCAGNKQF